jgi:hypothetical protein
MATCCNDARYNGGTRLTPYSEFVSTTPALPAFYWDVYSSEQRIKAMCCEIDKVINYADMLGVNLNATHDDVVKLQAEFEKFKDGEMLDFYEKQIQAWINANMERLIKQSLAKFVIPSITTDGYFCLYIPDSWNEIQFDFGVVYGRTDYGRIILRFDGEGNAIDNTYSYSLAQTQPLKKLIADLEVNAKRTDASYDTLFTNLNQEVTHAYD